MKYTLGHFRAQKLGSFLILASPSDALLILLISNFYHFFYLFTYIIEQASSLEIHLLFMAKRLKTASYLAKRVKFTKISKLIIQPLNAQNFQSRDSNRRPSERQSEMVTIRPRHNPNGDFICPIKNYKMYSILGLNSIITRTQKFLSLQKRGRKLHAVAQAQRFYTLEIVKVNKFTLFWGSTAEGQIVQCTKKPLLMYFIILSRLVSC